MAFYNLITIASVSATHLLSLHRHMILLSRGFQMDGVAHDYLASLRRMIRCMHL